MTRRVTFNLGYVTFVTYLWLDQTALVDQRVHAIKISKNVIKKRNVGQEIDQMSQFFLQPNANDVAKDREKKTNLKS